MDAAISWIYFAIPVGAAIVNPLIHITLFKFARNTTVVKAAVQAFFVCIALIVVVNLALIISGFYRGGEGAIMLLSNVIFYMMMGFIYFALVNIGESSLRIRILRIIRRSGTKGITTDEIFSEYNSSAIVDARIKRMVGNGQMLARDGKFYPGKARLIYLARIFEFFKLLIIGRRSDY